MRRLSLSLLVVLSTVLVVSLAGCGSGSGTSSKSGSSTSSQSAADATKPLKAQAEEDPTTEICDTMIKQAVTDIVREPYTTASNRSATDSICTYNFANGSLTLRVHTAKTNADANAYFDALRNDAGKVTTLSFGSPAFAASNGTTVMVKDNLVLVVDPTKAPAGVDRTNTAESLAAEVLACWTG
ncbi:MAG TPA: hypothetical protein VFC33_19440 [Acidimicrobiia bacterium]|nr:hypothetical protein [Acidimicrobiia bacterium]